MRVHRGQFKIGNSFTYANISSSHVHTLAGGALCPGHESCGIQARFTGRGSASDADGDMIVCIGTVLKFDSDSLSKVQFLTDTEA